MESKIKKVPTKSKWEIFYFISTYVLAIIAIAGFFTSIQTSKEVSYALKRMTSLTQPLIKLSKYEWVLENRNAPISKENPPLGIIFSYTNASSIPIQIVDTDFSVLYGDKILDAPGALMGSETKEIFILAPNDSIQSGTIQPENFKKYLGESKVITSPPFLNIKLSIKFKTMDGETYKYFVHREIQFSIDQPNLMSSKTLKESIIKLTAQ